MTYVKMKNNDGEYVTVNTDIAGNVSEFEKQGYSTDLDKPLDYDKLSANSVYRKENQQLIGDAYIPRQKINKNGKMSTAGTLGPTMRTQSAITTPTVNPLITALKARIQQQITQRQQQTQPLRNQSEVQKAQDLRNILERNANMGYGNTASRSNVLQSQIAGENRLNAINLQEQNDINDIQTEGIIQQSQIEADALRQAIEDARFNDNLAYQRSRDTIADEQNAEDREQSALNQMKQEFISTINRFANNFQAKINEVRNDGDASNDWQIAILEAARQDKIAREGLDQQGNKLPTAPKQMTYEQALNLWKAAGIASQQVADILGVPVGARTADYVQTEYDINKPYFAPKTGGGGSPSVAQQTADKKAASQQLTGDVMTYLDEWASGRAEDRNGQRADQNDMLNYLKSNSGTLTAQGVDVNALIKWVTDNYTWTR